MNPYHLERGYKNMKRMVCNIFISIALIIGLISLTSCKAIEAQNITNTSSNSGIAAIPGTSGGQGISGNRGTNSTPPKNSNQKTSNNAVTNGNLGKGE
jgi:hypothetical protein